MRRGGRSRPGPAPSSCPGVGRAAPDAARPTPVAVGAKVKVRTAVELVLSVDHRAIDGALAAQWMTALVDAVHQPLRLLV